MSHDQIYVDLDDVLSETARGFTVLLAEAFDRHVTFEQIVSFDLGISLGLNREELARFMHLAHLPERLEALQPVPGAAGALRRLSEQGYEIAVVTGRPASSGEATRRWLARHAVPYQRLAFVDKYGRGGDDGAQPPALTLEELARERFRFAVEDSADMAVFLAERMGLRVALLDRPWNRELGAAEPGGVIRRCRDWAEVVAWIEAGGPAAGTGMDHGGKDGG